MSWRDVRLQSRNLGSITNPLCPFFSNLDWWIFTTICRNHSWKIVAPIGYNCWHPRKLFWKSLLILPMLTFPWTLERFFFENSSTMQNIRKKIYWSEYALWNLENWDKRNVNARSCRNLYHNSYTKRELFESFLSGEIWLHNSFLGITSKKSKLRITAQVWAWLKCCYQNDLYEAKSKVGEG